MSSQINEKEAKKLHGSTHPFQSVFQPTSGAKFLGMINTCFPTENILYQNTIKVSYWYMPTIGRVILTQNSKIFNHKEQPDSL